MPEQENTDILEQLGVPEEGEPVPQDEENVDKIPDELLPQFLTADGEDGNIEATPDKEEEKKREEEIDVKISPSKIKQKVGKYSADFIDDIKKHPGKYTVETPRGRMTIKEALKQGWNPKTNEFDDNNSIDAINERHLSGLSQSDKDTIAYMDDPANQKFAPTDAEALGLDPNSPFIDHGNDALGLGGGAMPPGAEAMPPEAMAAQGGGLPPEAMAAGGQAPQAQAPAGGGIDPSMLAALMGGGNA